MVSSTPGEFEEFMHYLLAQHRQPKPVTLFLLNPKSTAKKVSQMTHFFKPSRYFRSLPIAQLRRFPWAQAVKCVLRHISVATKALWPVGIGRFRRRGVSLRKKTRSNSLRQLAELHHVRIPTLSYACWMMLWPF